MLVIIATWTICAWMLLRPDPTNWVGWRAADTQTIARHFTEPGSSIWYPRIDWGGSGPGYVESEFQLYPMIVAGALGIFGEVEWPGELVSLLAVAVSAWLLFRLLSERYGHLRAAFGVGAFLSVRSIIQISTAIQPEALCLLLCVAAWWSFLRYDASGRLRYLGLYGALGGLAMLIKPTAAQVGVAAFLLLLLGRRVRLRSVWPWLVWGLMVGALAAFLLHGRSIYQTYHNTFGVLSGGDTKVPKLQHLLMPGMYRSLVRTNVIWGLGAAGCLALAWLAVRRRVDVPTIALLASCAAWSLVAMRYVVNPEWGGSHYVIVAAVLAAHAMAAALPEDLERRSAGAYVVSGIAGILAIAAGLTFLVRRRELEPNRETQQILAVAEQLKRLVHAGDLVVVRSSRWRHDEFWQSGNNFEDPRVFYLTRTRGWVLAREDVDATRLVGLAAAGAKFYVEPGRDFLATPIDEWLAAHAELVATTDLEGRVFRLRAPVLTP